MTERDLTRLKDLQAPAPSTDARARARAAALAAFDLKNENSETATQGVRSSERLTSTSSQQWRPWMRSKQTYAIAASVAVVGLAVPATLYHLKSRDVSRSPSLPLASSAPGAASQPLPGIAVAARTDAGRADVQATPAPPVATRTTEVPLGDVKLDIAKGTKPKDERIEIGNVGTDKATIAEQSQTREQGAPAPLQAQGPRRATVSDESTRHGYAIAATGNRPAEPASPPSSGIVAAAPAVSAQQTLPATAPGLYRQESDGRARKLDGVIAGTPPSAAAPPMRQAMILPPHDAPPAQAEDNRDRFASAEPGQFKQVANEPVSTFSVDVDTASYAFVRRALNAGRLPPREAVRIEEMINYFPYNYNAPESATVPFQPSITVVPSPWHADRKLVHVALKGYALNATERPRANLVLLVDVSGSMAPADRLPLLKSGFRMLVEHLKPDDTVAIVTYANNTRVALEPTKALDKGRILQVIDSLQAGGGTYGEGGLQRAYALAQSSFDKAAVNRVLLATDGDFNIGISDHTQLKAFVEGKRQTGIFLSVLGVGHGNHNDRLMQALAQNGNGVAAYIDTLSEARKVLIEEASSSIFPIAKDVKIQVEFNPSRVQDYRLIGYETRALKREDFNNDKVDAGDVGSGHTVTAIYEITPTGAAVRTVDDLRYQRATQATTDRLPPTAASSKDGEYGFFKLRYKLPAEETSRLIEVAITQALEQRILSSAPVDVRFGVAVAAFGQLLKGSSAAGKLDWEETIALAQSARGDDPFGYRAELVNLMRLAKSLPR